MMILNLTIVLLISVPKAPFWGKFGPETQRCFVFNETRHMGYSRRLILNPKIVFVNSVLKTPFW